MPNYTLDESQAKLDSTVRLIDSFYDQDVVVNPNEFDLVNSYFLSVCDSSSIAKNFTSFLFKIAANTGTPVLELLDEIRGKTSLEMNSIISYYLNLYKSKHSLFGVSVVPKPVGTVQRNILV